MTVPHGTPDLSALIARLEAATGPSPNLDAEIAAAVDAREIAPRYTASLDAAFLLVPKATVAVHLHCNLNLWTKSQSNANVVIDGTPRWGVGATGPLALCIAALKARMAI